MDLLDDLVGTFQNLIISAAFLMFLVAIFYYVGSGGDSKKVGKAKEYLLSAVTALVALVLVKIFLPGGVDVGSPEPLKQIVTNPISEIINAIECPATGCPTGALAIFDVATTILAGVASIIIYAIPIFALLMTMYAGLQYIFSAGNPKKSEEAIKLLNTSIIGFAAFLMLAALWVFIRDFIGA